jgi:hypothetical protein
MIEPQPITEPKKTSSLPIIILTILLLFSLGFSGFLYHQTTLKQKQINTLTELYISPNNLPQHKTNTATTSPVHIVCPTIKANPTNPNPKPDSNILFLTSRFKRIEAYKYLTIIKTKNSEVSDVISNLYTDKWFWCGASSGIRLLPSNYESYLLNIGKIGDQDVYALSETTPVINDVHVFPTEKQYGQEPLISDPESSKGSDENIYKWKTFLQNQEKLDYPLIILQVEGQYPIYIRIDYLFLPGC